MLQQHTIDKLRRLQDYLRKNPEQFNLSLWGARAETREQLVAFLGEECLLHDHTTQEVPMTTACSTMACLAGNHCIIEGLVKERTSTSVNGFVVYEFSDNTPEIAQESLGLTVEQATRLFYGEGWTGRKGDGWPEEFMQRLVATVPGSPEYAAVAIDRIEHFITTGGDE